MRNELQLTQLTFRTPAVSWSLKARKPLLTGIQYERALSVKTTLTHLELLYRPRYTRNTLVRCPMRLVGLHHSSPEFMFPRRGRNPSRMNLSWTLNTLADLHGSRRTKETEIQRLANVGEKGVIGAKATSGNERLQGSDMESLEALRVCKRRGLEIEDKSNKRGKSGRWHTSLRTSIDTTDRAVSSISHGVGWSMEFLAIV